jgi:hypothetical protein
MSLANELVLKNVDFEITADNLGCRKVMLIRSAVQSHQLKLLTLAEQCTLKAL